MQSLNKQKGMSFISWMVVAAIFIFIAITVIKVAPMYVKFNSVKSMVEDIAADPTMLKASKQAIMIKISNYINVNSLDGLTHENFVVEKVQNSKKQRSISVSYKDRQTWFANLDIIGNFEYSKVIGAE